MKLYRTVSGASGRRFRRMLPALLPALALLPGCGKFGSSVVSPDGPPNVVVVVIDTLRADHLTQYGYARNTGAGLESFASDATLFTKAYSTSSWTVPSVSSLLTGQLPMRHGVVKQSMALPDDLQTLAETLSAAGWRSGGFSGNLFIGAKTNFDQGFETFEDHDGRVLAYPDADDMIEGISSWLGAPEAAADPVFLYFQPMNCHGPYRVPEARRADLLGTEPSRDFRYQGGPMKAILKERDLAARDLVTPDYLQSLTDQYDTAVRYSIDAVGRLMRLLRDEGLYRNSLIVVTSDHGEELFEHGGFSHAYSLYEEVIRVPLWIKLPEQTKSAEMDSPASLVDLFPTILDALELAPAADAAGAASLDGQSLLPVLRGEGDPAASRRRSLVFDTRWTRRAVASAIRKDRFKLIEVESNYEGLENERLLFDLEADPAEKTNLAALSTREADALAGELASIRARLQAGLGERPDAEVPEVELDSEALKALGYID